MLVADVMGVVGFSLQMAGKLCDTLQVIVDAPGDMETLRLEATYLKGLLAHILETTYNTGGEANRSPDVLRLRRDLIERARKQLEDANRLIEKVTKVKGDGTRRVKRTIWLLHTADVKDLAESFKDLYLVISAVYAVDASLRTRFIESGVPSLERIMDAMTPTMERLLDEDRIVQIMVRSLTIVLQQQREGRHQLFDELNSLHGNAETAHELPERLSSLTDSVVIPASPLYSEPGPSMRTTDSSTQTISTSAISQSLHSTSPPEPVLPANRMLDPLKRRCPSDCQCRCHKRPKDRLLIPIMLRSWLGDIRIPEGFIASLLPSNISCNDSKCVQTVKILSILKWYLPTVSARVQAEVESQSFRLNFVIQTPRVVASLDFLDSLTFEELKIKLSTRELTVNDVDPVGFTVLHNMAYMIVRNQRSDAHEMMRYLMDVGAPHDWEYDGQTVTEYVTKMATYWYGHTSAGSVHLRFFEYNVARPLFQNDMVDAWEWVRTKRCWSDLHYLLANPPGPPAQLKAGLTRILGQPDTNLHLNAHDRSGRTPLYEAIYSCPEAVDALLRAGANPRLVLGSLGSAVLGACSWCAIGPLVRAGADVNECYDRPNGHLQTALHDVIRFESPFGPGTRLPCALELVRHAGHLLDWDVGDEDGNTPLWWANRQLNEYSDDEDVVSIYQLYRTQKLPLGAQLIDKSRLHEDADAAIHLESTSLITAGLSGNVQAVGELIDAGAMVNERDAFGRTLLHLLAIGVVPNAHAIALELVQQGACGVDWNAQTVDGETAEQLAKETLDHLPAISDEQREEASDVLNLLQRRALPEGVDYIYPSIHADYCKACSARPCSGYCSNGLRMPGALL